VPSYRRESADGCWLFAWWRFRRMARLAVARRTRRNRSRAPGIPIGDAPPSMVQAPHCPASVRAMSDFVSVSILYESQAGA
jgi:hypothetical protein